MAGDTLRGIGKKAIAEALEAAAAAEHATETNGTAPASAFALGDNQGRPERSLDELPSERTGNHPPGDPTVAATNHTGNDALAEMPITTAPTLVQDAPAPTPGAATLPGASTAINAAVTMVDDAAPLGSSSSAPRSGPNRVSFGTMIGHEVHAVHARVADAESAVRGTAHGHDVHLPGHPAMGMEAEIAPGVAPAPSVRGLPVSHGEPASALAEYLAPARDSQNEFSGGDHSFFDTAPINDEYEPENPRGRLYTRLAVSGAVVAVVAVVVVAWANSRGAREEPPVEVKAQPVVAVPVRTAVATPAPARPAPPQEPPTSTIPSSMPERIAVTTPPPHPAKAPSLAPPAPAPAARPAVPVAAAAKSAGVAVSAAPLPKPAPAAAPPAPVAAAASKPASVTAAVAAAPKASAPVAAAPAAVRELRTPPPPPQKKPAAVAAAAPHPTATSTPHAAASAPTPPSAPRPAPTVAKVPQSAPSRPVAKSTPARASKAPARGKQKYDPDGTLPLSFE